MTADQLQAALSVLGHGMAEVRGVIASTDYFCPTREWLTPFGAALKLDLERLGASNYVLARNDCTDFSLYSMALARLAHNLSTSATSALAFGTIDYLKADLSGQNPLPQGHRINVVIVLEGGTYQVLFFEPQSQKVVELSQDERDSVRAYYL